MGKRTTSTWLVGVLAALAGSMVIAAPAYASASDAEVTAMPTKATPNCVVNVKTGEHACSADGLAAADAVGVAGGTTLSYMYADANWNNDKPWIRWARGESNYYCTETGSDFEHGHSDFTAFGWNDRVSSLWVNAKRNCSLKIFEHTGYRGKNRWIHDREKDLAWIGWQDMISSVKIT